MTDLNAGDLQDDEFKDFDAEEPPNHSALENEAEVTCPYCGEPVVIALDPAGGAAQDYVEDCQVCCRPWRVTVQFGHAGAAEVRLERAD